MTAGPHCSAATLPKGSRRRFGAMVAGAIPTARRLISFDADFGALRMGLNGIGDTLTVNLLGREDHRDDRQSAADRRWTRLGSKHFAIVFAPGTLRGGAADPSRRALYGARRRRAGKDDVMRRLDDEVPELRSAIPVRETLALRRPHHRDDQPKAAMRLGIARWVTVLAGILVLGRRDRRRAPPPRLRGRRLEGARRDAARCDRRIPDRARAGRRRRGARGRGHRHRRGLCRRDRADAIWIGCSSRGRWRSSSRSVIAVSVVHRLCAARGGRSASSRRRS